ncbi:EPIDERMAL PATTERNING FACTOR-like protein 1 [Dioscorea cayenensis subsp. rotundata]|uniref:Epidermal patterning factor-like protein n=1 Tax=Dioscorea cayennensis subsp. rotundata TaxID=55577 RepID=A0AB40B8X0_DIOCR|nr:EPIDERMAL PATTERNING FACTOR-like protein 1 [Dioscorea cayenensis subsp. rotundata]
MNSLLFFTLLANLFLASLAATPQGMVMDEKIRLGSTPPSCRNRCKECSPCAAVQVPTLPGAAPALPAGNYASYNMYSNYKPLGWKCQCGKLFFNP